MILFLLSGVPSELAVRETRAGNNPTQNTRREKDSIAFDATVLVQLFSSFQALLVRTLIISAVTCLAMPSNHQAACCWTAPSEICECVQCSCAAVGDLCIPIYTRLYIFNRWNLSDASFK